MTEKWIPLPLDKGFFANLDADAVVGYQTGIENGFVNEIGGNTRFPGLREVADVGDPSPLVLSDFDGDLIAGNRKGQVFRINRRYDVSNVTGVPATGGRRMIFAKTDRELLAAAGGPIIRLRSNKTELLSSAAPLATHVGWIDGFTIATEVNSGRFYHSGAGTPDQWDPLDTFSADGNPDNINSLLITPFRELMLGGPDSIEQFERLPTGDVPFFRRWAVGDGVKFAYMMLFADNAVWTVNNLTEFVRFSGQISTASSAEVGRLLEKIDDWRDAWIGGYPDRPLHIVGQKFILLQAPYATNEYGTKGVTLLFNYRDKKWQALYGWDAAAGVPTRWPGWSHWYQWNKVYVGGNGKVYELTDDVYRHGSEIQRWLIRTANIADTSLVNVKNFRLHIKRGLGSSAADAPTVRVRCSRNGKPYGAWVTRSLGKAGDNIPFVYFGGFGVASSHRFEIMSADNCPIELLSAQVLTEAIGH